MALPPIWANLTAKALPLTHIYLRAIFNHSSPLLNSGSIRIYQHSWEKNLLNQLLLLWTVSGRLLWSKVELLGGGRELERGKLGLLTPDRLCTRYLSWLCSFREVSSWTFNPFDWIQAHRCIRTHRWQGIANCGWSLKSEAGLEEIWTWMQVNKKIQV